MKASRFLYVQVEIVDGDHCSSLHIEPQKFLNLKGSAVQILFTASDSQYIKQRTNIASSDIAFTQITPVYLSAIQ
jgi:hypothetical protein